MVEFIMYHYVRDLKNSRFPKIKGLDYSHFVDQLKFLKKEYNILSIDEFINNDYNINKKNCVLTFDDGYIDHYDFVFPTLVKENVQGSFYSPVDTIIDNKLLDVNMIHIILASSTEKKILERIFYHYNRMVVSEPLSTYISKINTDDRYDTKTTIIIKRLLQTVLPSKIRTIICRLLLKDFLEEDENSISKSFYLSKENIKEMISEGMHFGSHGKSHLWFSGLDKTEQKKEITSSINFLDSLYNKDYNLTMSYPYGDYNETTLKILSECNFKLALTTVPQTYIKEKDNLFEIPRWDTNDYYPIKKNPQ
jgi:peptidoglycan/xylan/chitin deacetylase (PgdA/CDA1 family)